MKNKNYSKFSENSNNKIPEQVIQPLDQVVEFVENDEEVLPLKPTGVVSGCEKLYVRKGPDKSTESLCIIDKDTEVEIEMDESTSDFYKVCTASGIEGYCMKKFIALLAEKM